MRLKRKILTLLLISSIFLLDGNIINLSSAEIVNFSDVVDVGNSFIWYVKKYDVYSVDRPETETTLKEGDCLNITFDELPEINISTSYLFTFGLTSSNISLNGDPFTQNFQWIPSPFFFGWIYPISFIREDITYDYFEAFYQMMEERKNSDDEYSKILKNKLTDNYYEIERTWDTSETDSPVRQKSYTYIKFDRNTGIILVHHEKIEFYLYQHSNTSTLGGEIIFTYDDVIYRTDIFPGYVILPIMLISIISIKRKRKMREN